jgi:hypothetical protein
MRMDVVVYAILILLIVGWFYYHHLKTERILHELDKEYTKVDLALGLNGTITEVKRLSVFRVDSNFCRCEIDMKLKVEIGVNEIGESPRFLRVARTGATLL